MMWDENYQSNKKSINALIEDVKEATTGMLSVPVYLRYSEYARNLFAGNIFDVGTGQGGSTISLALGLKMNPVRSSQHYVYALDQFYQRKQGGPHPFCLADHDCINRNIAAFKANLERFNVENIVKVIPGELKGFPVELNEDTDIGLLVIDTDGYIDRDFDIFFDKVPNNGIIIVDDYANKVNPSGRKNLAAVEGLTKLETEGYVNGLKNNRFSGGARILGKHKLTFELAQYYMSRGAIELLEVISDTLFARKTTTEKYRSLIDPDQVAYIKDKLQQDFIDLALRKR